MVLSDSAIIGVWVAFFALLGVGVVLYILYVRAEYRAHKVGGQLKAKIDQCKAVEHRLEQAQANLVVCQQTCESLKTRADEVSSAYEDCDAPLRY